MVHIAIHGRWLRYFFFTFKENDRLIYTVGITFFIYCKIFARTLREKKSMPATLKHW